MSYMPLCLCLCACLSWWCLRPTVFRGKLCWIKNFCAILANFSVPVAKFYSTAKSSKFHKSPRPFVCG